MKTMADHARAYRQRRSDKIARYEAALREIAETQVPTALGVDHSEWTAMAFDEFQVIARQALDNTLPVLSGSE